MYKVFFKRKPLILTTSKKIVRDSEILIDSKSSNYNILISALKSKKNKSVLYFNSDPSILLKHFEKCFSIVEAAGGMVVNENNEYLMIFRNDKWDLPKGHLKKNELNLEGASRELTEETGVKKLSPILILPSTYHFIKKNKIYKLKKTRWFLFRSSFKGELIPQSSEGIVKAEWKTKKEIKNCMTKMYPNIKELFDIHFNQSFTDIGTREV